jgi:hypothetical protein
MTEPAVLPFESRSCLFDDGRLRDPWPRLQFPYTIPEAAVTTIVPLCWPLDMNAYILPCQLIKLLVDYTINFQNRAN